MTVKRAVRNGTPCSYCRRPMNYRDPKLRPTREHEIPESKGGTKIIPACFQCNQIKGDMMPEVWANFMKRCPQWWKMTKTEIRDAKHVLGIINGRRDQIAHVRMAHMLNQQKEET